MPLQTRASALTSKLLLPPPFTLVSLREMGDAFAHAISVAAAQGAGTLVHVGRFDLAEFAVVLEPEEPLKTARRAIYAGMAALTDALAAHAQPETAIRIDWPDSILVNGGLVGGGRLAWPQGASEDETPAWLVFGAMVRTASLTGHEPGAKSAHHRAGGGRLRRRSRQSIGRELRQAFDGRHRRLAGGRLRRSGPALFRAHAARERRAPRYRRQRRPSDPPHGQARRRAQGAAAVAGEAGLVRPGEQRAAGMKLLRTIQLDPSDTFIFEPAAAPGEWAVPGAFVFWDRDPTTLEGKARSAFRGGFLGVDSPRLVDAGADRRGERSRPHPAGGIAGATALRTLRRPRHDRRTRRGGRGSDLRRFAVQRAAGHADRRASHL